LYEESKMSTQKPLIPTGVKGRQNPYPSTKWHRAQEFFFQIVFEIVFICGVLGMAALIKINDFYKAVFKRQS
jgi:hypothetical protein